MSDDYDYLPEDGDQPEYDPYAQGYDDQGNEGGGDNNMYEDMFNNATAKEDFLNIIDLESNNTSEVTW